MSVIYPNYSFYPQKYNAPYPNIYNQMKEMITKLVDSRIILKNLVYIIGLSSELIKIDSKLKSFEYFGQYGKINKLVINKNKIYNSNGPNGPSYTCYITYSSVAESSLAILSLDKSIIDKHQIKANYGTTKYCLNFIKNSKCKNKDCIYYHKFADQNDIVSKQQLSTDKDLFPQQRLMAIELSQILTNAKYRELYKLRDIKTVFPNSFNVYKKDLVINYIQQNHLGICLNLNVSELTIEKNINNKNNFNLKSNEDKIKYDENEEKNVLNKNKILLNNIEQIKKFSEYKKSINNLYKSAPKSRFNFVNENIPDEKEINQIIPSQLNDFITKLFEKHSLIFKQEKHDLSLYYFSLKPTYLDSNDSWSSLISTLKKWNDENELKENDMTKKFYTF